MDNIIVYTDGACKSNPGKGGWSCLIQPTESEYTYILYGSVDNTTNNRMEMVAVLNSLNYISLQYGVNSRIKLYTDSKYIEQSINKGWLDKWIESSFKGIKNVDLWVKIYGYLNKLNIEFEWVRGHDGNTYNELVDYYASMACEKETKLSSNIVKRVDIQN